MNVNVNIQRTWQAYFTRPRLAVQAPAPCALGHGAAFLELFRGVQARAVVERRVGPDLG
jgi:hypothetical protein